MSHFTTTTPTMCAFLLFTPCAFHSHPHHTNGAHVMVSPMVCSVIQPMSCAIHISLQHNHTLTLASHHNRHTPCGKCHHSKCQTMIHNHGEGNLADACTHEDKAELHSVLGVGDLHGDFMKGNGALTQCLNDLSKGSVFTWGKQQETAFSMVKQVMSDK